jgi:L-2,4-diaminobutyrate transaminase
MDIKQDHNLSLEEMDKQSFLHPYTALKSHLETGPDIIVSGHGVRLTNAAGKQFIDAVAGLWCVNIGWGHQEVVEAIAKQAEDLAYYHSFFSMGTEAPIRLADRVLRLVPDNMSKIMFGNSGSDANDTNVKLVWYYNNLLGRPEKQKIISRRRGYHGVTVAAASLTGLPAVHAAFNLPLPMARHTETPHYWRHAEPGMSERDFSGWCAKRLEEMILEEGPDTVAAFIAEPVMGAGGVIIPPEGYFPEIQKVLRKYDVLMIADEVITGFGRTGNWFGSETYDIEPDIMTIAKGLTSGYVPMSGSIISEEIWQVIKEGPPGVSNFAHGYTYGAHPVAAAAAMANLDIMERLDLPAKCADVGAYFQRRLREVAEDHPLVGEVRGEALLAAVELVADRESREPFDPDLLVGPTLGKYAMEEGLIIRSLPLSDAVSFSPPLVITEAEVDEALDLFKRALDRLTDELMKAGTWRPKARS